MKSNHSKYFTMFVCCALFGIGGAGVSYAQSNHCEEEVPDPFKSVVISSEVNNFYHKDTRGMSDSIIAYKLYFKDFEVYNRRDQSYTAFTRDGYIYGLDVEDDKILVKESPTGDQQLNICTFDTETNECPINVIAEAPAIDFIDIKGKYITWVERTWTNPGFLSKLMVCKYNPASGTCQTAELKSSTHWPFPFKNPIVTGDGSAVIYLNDEENDALSGISLRDQTEFDLVNDWPTRRISEFSTDESWIVFRETVQNGAQFTHTLTACLFDSHQNECISEIDLADSSGSLLGYLDPEVSGDVVAFQGTYVDEECGYRNDLFVTHIRKGDPKQLTSTDILSHRQPQIVGGSIIYHEIDAHYELPSKLRLMKNPFSGTILPK